MKSLSSFCATIAAAALLTGCGAVDFKFKDAALEAANAARAASYLPQNTADVRTKIGDRFHTKSVLESVFGTLDATSLSLLENTSAFAGSEDLYKNTMANFGDLRGQLPLSQLTYTPTPLSAREALRIRVCNASLGDDTRLHTAVSNALGLNSSQSQTRTQSAANTNDFQALFVLFYPGRTAPDAVIANLQNLAVLAKNDASANGVSVALAQREGWRFSLLALCLDPGWQTQ